MRADELDKKIDRQLQKKNNEVLSKMIAQQLSEAITPVFKELKQVIRNRINELDKSVKAIELKSPDSVLIKNDSLNVTGKVKDTDLHKKLSDYHDQLIELVAKIERIKLEVPDSFSIDNEVQVGNMIDIAPLQQSVDEVIDVLKNIDTIKVELPYLTRKNENPSQFINVRLTDGIKYINPSSSSIAPVLPTVTSTETGKTALSIANADGSLVSGGGGGTTDGTFDFMDGTDAAFMDGTDMAFMSG